MKRSLLLLSALILVYSESVAAGDLDLHRYCRDRGFSQATLINGRWLCTAPGRSLNIDYAAACRHQYGVRYRPYHQDGRWQCGEGIGMRDLPPPRR